MGWVEAGDGSGLLTMLAQIGPRLRPTMLDELMALTLLLLVVTHGLLVRGCFKLNDALPTQGDLIASRIERTSDLLDEVAQLIADLGDTGPSTAVAQSQGVLPDLLTMFLQRQAVNAVDHAPQEGQWTVHPPSDNPSSSA